MDSTKCSHFGGKIWLHTWNLTSDVWHDSFTYVWHGSFIRVTSLIHKCTMTHSSVRHTCFLLFLLPSRTATHTATRTATHTATRTATHTYMHLLIPRNPPPTHTQFQRQHHPTYPLVYHDSFRSATYVLPSFFVPWLIHKYDMRYRVAKTHRIP